MYLLQVLLCRNNIPDENDQFSGYPPESSKGIKASIGGEDFLMYRVNEFQYKNYPQNKDDDCDSVEIELQNEDEHIYQINQN